VLISIISPKGGSGCSVVSCVVAYCLADKAQTLLVDACKGDISILSDIDDFRYSFDEWCVSDVPTAESLINISEDVSPDLAVVAGLSGPSSLDSASTGFFSYEKRSHLVDELCKVDRHCVVDLGQRTDLLAQDIVAASDLVLCVLRQCYVGLYRATHHPFVSRVDAFVVIEESGRSISVSQIAETLHADVVIEMQARRDFARVIDAGVLLYRMPVQLRTPVESFLRDVMDTSHNPDDIFTETTKRNNESFWGRDEVRGSLARKSS
jgi:cellulose biosynthesis protein BcsQ